MSRHPAFRAALQRNPRLAPKDGTVLSFVLWLQQRGLHGEWLQSELFDTYEGISDLAGFSHTSRKRFKEALREAGCECWQADVEQDGKRFRPEMVRIPKQS
jgi:hypothetical protein